MEKKYHELTEKIWGARFNHGRTGKERVEAIIREDREKLAKELNSASIAHAPRNINRFEIERILGLTDEGEKPFDEKLLDAVADITKRTHSKPEQKQSWCERWEEVDGQNFFKYVDFPDDEDGCWEWVGGKNEKGYGYYYDGHRNHRAHRYAYMMSKGEIPVGFVVMHSCDNMACVRPNHLSIGTMADNIRDREEKGRGAKGEKHGAYKDGSRVGEPRSGTPRPTPKPLVLRLADVIDKADNQFVDREDIDTAEKWTVHLAQAALDFMREHRGELG